MALEGTLSDFSLADIFQLIGIQSKTGVLTLSSPSATVRVTFKDGKVVNADSMRKGVEDRLGTVLVRTGRISEEQLGEALKMQKETLQQLGHILVSRKYLTSEELADSLRMQVTQVVYRLFRWKEGEYHFDQDADLGRENGSFEPLSAESILMEGVRMLDEWPLIESRIPSQEVTFKKANPRAQIEVVDDEVIDRDDDTALQNLLGGAKHDGRVRLTQSEAIVYAKVDGHQSVHDLVDSINLYEFDVCKSLYDMAERNVIVEATEAPPQAEPETARREVSPGLVRVLYGVVAAWLLLSILTLRYNPLDYWAYPPSPAMKAQYFRAASLRLSLEHVSLALEAYKLSHGKYPPNLDELVKGKLLTAVEASGPRDAHLKYEVKDEGFALSYEQR